MKKFRFRLENLYRLRKEEERQALFFLNGLQQEEASVLAEIRNLGSERKRWMEYYNDMGTRPSSSHEAILTEQYLVQLERQQNYQEQELRKLRVEIENASELVRRAYRAKRQIEHLRDKQRERHDELVAGLEKREADEMSTMRFVHRKLTVLAVIALLFFSAGLRAEEAVQSSAEAAPKKAAEAAPSEASKEAAPEAAKPSEEKTLSDVIRSRDTRVEFVSHEKELYVNLKREMERSEREKKKNDSLKILEEELKRREGELAKLSEELSKKIDKKTADNDNLKLLINLYESLQATQAADLMKRMPVRVSVTMIKMMSPKKASKIIAAMDPKLATLISKELIRLPENAPASVLKQAPVPSLPSGSTETTASKEKP